MNNKHNVNRELHLQEQDDPQNTTPCTLDFCIFEHKINCTVGEHCTDLHCTSSRQTITHWNNCDNSNCQMTYICKLVSSFNATLGANAQMNHLQNESNSGQVNEDDSQMKEWHASLTLNRRNHLRSIFVESLLPSVTIHDQRIKRCVAFTRKVEKYMFEAARDWKEYTYLLRVMLYKIRKALREKKNIRLTEQLGPAAAGGSVDTHLMPNMP
ncbi:KIX domain-containing protein [Ditylenchus destructor]|nr:KIX domain-containing protein [Ditylenchus destructor]